MFVLFGLLAVNSTYLVSVTIAEAIGGRLLQDYVYQVMFLAHLVLGLVIVLPAIVFGALHMRNALPRPNYRAVRAGLALYASVILLLASGIVLTRFDFFSVRDPTVRGIAYWVHVITPLLVVALFILHRLAGSKVRYRPGMAWGAAAVALTALALLPKLNETPQDATPEVLAANEAKFFPALSRTETGDYLSADVLMMDGYCQDCHSDVHAK